MLLLPHGFASSSAQYQSLTERLEDRYHVIAPDYPGFGQTPPIEGPTTFDRLADVVEAFADGSPTGRIARPTKPPSVGPYSWRPRARSTSTGSPTRPP